MASSVLILANLLQSVSCSCNLPTGFTSSAERCTWFRVWNWIWNILVFAMDVSLYNLQWAKSSLGNSTPPLSKGITDTRMRMDRQTTEGGRVRDLILIVCRPRRVIFNRLHDNCYVLRSPDGAGRLACGVWTTEICQHHPKDELGLLVSEWVNWLLLAQKPDVFTSLNLIHWGH